MSDQDPLVSLALPIKNGMPALRATVEALQRQTYRHFELVVQDALSSDESVAYLRGALGEGRLSIVSAADSGLVEGYDRALRRCQGDLVLAIACDEYLEDDAIARCVQWYRELPDAAFVYGGSRLRDGAGAVVQDFQPPAFELKGFLRLDVVPPIAGGYFNRRLIGGELRLDLTLKTCPDFELLSRLALRFGDRSIVRRDGRIANARADSVSMTFRPENYDQFVRDKGTVITRLCQDTVHAADLGPHYREFMSGLYAWAAESVLALSGDDERFRSYVRRAGEYDPGSARVLALARTSRHLRPVS